MPNIWYSSATRRTKTIWLFVLILLVFPLIVAISLYDALDPVLAFFGKGTTTPGSVGKKLPNTGTRQMKFSEHDDYMSLSHDFDSLWADLLPPNGGFILRPDKNGVNRKHGISMFHQLHCLGMMRDAVQDMTERLTAAEKPGPHGHAEKRGSHGLHDPLAHDDHWLHCFDYLRQAILCNADATIEPPSITFQGNGIIDGMIQRECKDWNTLYSAATEHDGRP
ncbi:hypothetical protein AB5N19_06973 [Seiridium cardinale]|uniref:Oxidase ustYa n=1 Tax=Seiridium cardinale TaxID=138064 RepID=A0ABR2XDX3_9PEZI